MTWLGVVMVRDANAILRRLHDAGYEVGSLAELRRSGTKYAKAVPILVESLSASSEDRALTEEIVRALSVPWARPAATGPLIDLFRQVDDPRELGLRWTIGNALEVVWDDRFFEDLVEIARDKSYGRSREMVVLGIARSKRPEAADVLIDLLNDADVNGHAVKALSKFKASRARPGLEQMTSDSRSWVRTAARKAIRNLD